MRCMRLALDVHPTPAEVLTLGKHPGAVHAGVSLRSRTRGAVHAVSCDLEHAELAEACGSE